MCLVKVYSEEFGEVFTNDFEIIKESDSSSIVDAYSKDETRTPCVNSIRVSYYKITT